MTISNVKHVKKLSVVIPTFNEEMFIGRLLHHLKISQSGFLSEIIVVDGGSTDKTIEIAQSHGARVIYSLVKGRAFQMNLGAEKSTGDILFFLHADSFPPHNLIKLFPWLSLQKDPGEVFGSVLIPATGY